MENIIMNERMPRRNLLIRIISFSWMKKQLIVEIISLFFVILFLYTGLAKLLDFDVFQEQLGDSPIVGFAAPVVAWGLPITEFIISLALFIPKYRLQGLYAAFILMILFTGYVGILLSISTKLPCSCGGILAQLSWKQHLLFNTVSVFLAAVGIKLMRQIARNEL